MIAMTAGSDDRLGHAGKTRPGISRGELSPFQCLDWAIDRCPTPRRRESSTAARAAEPEPPANLAAATRMLARIV